ncbi:unnamed protein product [Arctia plantaginis]|uniref:Uncharacterized protein n=1 Tax=Arctia plantaginis TaxID=874455 RepID=A0A8S0YTL0_ARCPL|nr:unnamed protein product [Arctia plantaginis]
MPFEKIADIKTFIQTHKSNPEHYFECFGKKKIRAHSCLIHVTKLQLTIHSTRSSALRRDPTISLNRHWIVILNEKASVVVKLDDKQQEQIARKAKKIRRHGAKLNARLKTDRSGGVHPGDIGD